MPTHDYLTRKHNAKVRRTNDTKLDRQNRRERALKAVRLTLNATPAQEIAALETYIENLRDLEQELKRDYGSEELRNALGYVQVEINRTVEQIAMLKIDNIKPE